jgi:hypothetical protein
VERHHGRHAWQEGMTAKATTENGMPPKGTTRKGITGKGMTSVVPHAAQNHCGFSRWGALWIAATPMITASPVPTLAPRA